jgi:group I intron endonuclease
VSPGSHLTKIDSSSVSSKGPSAAECIAALPAVAGIYCWRNKVNGKRYVGQSQDMRRRCQDHCTKEGGTYLHHSLRKYGLGAFEVTVLEECAIELLSDREIFWIAELNTLFPAGYNFSRGGEFSPTAHPEVRAKMRIKVRAAMARPAVKAKCSAASRARWSDPAYQSKQRAMQSSAEIRAKKSAATVALWADAERRGKMSAAMASPEYRAKQRASCRSGIDRRRAAAEAAKLATDRCPYCGLFMSAEVKRWDRNASGTVICCCECMTKRYHGYRV